MTDGIEHGPELDDAACELLLRRIDRQPCVPFLGARVSTGDGPSTGLLGTRASRRRPSGRH